MITFRGKCSFWEICWLRNFQPEVETYMTLCVDLDAFSLALCFQPIILLYTVKELLATVGVLHMLNTDIDTLGKDLAPETIQRF